jgi:hypothetical protein
LTCSPSSSSFCPILGKNAFAGLCLNAKIARAKERECVYFWAVFTSLHFRNGDITFLRYFFFFGFPLRNNRERERPTLVKETCVCTWKGWQLNFFFVRGGNFCVEMFPADEEIS